MESVEDRRREYSRLRYHTNPDVKARVRAFRQTDEFRARKREETRKYKERHPVRHKAHLLIKKAIGAGLIEKKPCEWCGRPDAVAHHWDYGKPFEVEWFCRAHHSLIHRCDRAYRRKLSNG